MPLRHWPCSCDPNCSLGQVHDWISEIYEKFTLAHGKGAAMAKKIELKGWDYPKHLEGRAYGVMVHADAAGAQEVRRNLCDWLDTLGFLGAGTQAKLDRYIGYYEPYATSHDTLDDGKELQEGMRIIARAFANTVSLMRAGRFPVPDAKLESPCPK